MANEGWRWVAGCLGLLAVAACAGAKELPEMKLYDAITQACAGRAPCEIELAALTPFTWDRVGFVPMHASNKKAALAMGVAALSRPDFEDWIVFVRAGEVVGVERRAYEPEAPFQRTVFLSAGASPREVVVVPLAQARFRASVVPAKEAHNVELVLLAP